MFGKQKKNITNTFETDTNGKGKKLKSTPIKDKKKK